MAVQRSVLAKFMDIVQIFACRDSFQLSLIPF
jgi:hypothetical protein